MPASQSPLVSVLMTAYRHEATVAQAVRSALSQATEFPFEVIIGVDASEDETGAEVERLQSESHGMVRGVHHAARVGIFRNFASVYEAARGEILALLEGDDYWTEPSKLQRQVDLLARHSQMSLCGHSTRIDRADPSHGRIPGTPYPERVTGVEFLARGCDLHLSSLVFRNQLGSQLPRALTDERTRAFDLALKVLLANRADVGFIPEEMSVFRSRSGSLSSSFDADRAGWLRAMLLSLRLCRPHLGDAERREADRFAARLLFALTRANGLRARERWAATARGAIASPRLAAVELNRLARRSLPPALRAAARRLRRPTGRAS